MVEQIEQTNRYTLANRYVFTGTLFMETAFHIGGGRVTLSSSDSPIVLTPEELPFIPGSSFKGALRSTIEKLVPNFPGDWSTCALIDLSDKEAEVARNLRGLRDQKLKKARDLNDQLVEETRGLSDQEAEVARKLRDQLVEEARELDQPVEEARKQGQFCPTVWSKDIADKRRKEPARAKEILEEAREDLCDTCKLFGSPLAASHININDLYLSDEGWSGVTQIRDGVAIDRDSEKAKDRLKYDFEVVPANASFDLTIMLENASDRDLQLICVGLSEFVNGFGVIGGKRSRGLGVCKLKDLYVSELKLIGKDTDGTDIDEKKRSARLRDYLLHRTYSGKYAGKDFLEKQINRIFE